MKKCQFQKKNGSYNMNFEQPLRCHYLSPFPSLQITPTTTPHHQLRFSRCYYYPTS